MTIADALSLLDPKDDSHWTAEGDPRLDIISDLVGETVKRAQITEVAPDLTREKLADAQNESESETESSEDASKDEEPSEEEALLAALQDELKGLSEKHAKIHKEIDKANAKLKRVNSDIAEVQAQIEAMQPKDTNALRIRRYLDSQNKQRAERAANAKVVRDALAGQDPDPRAPVDKAFSRGRNRHGKRPRR